MPYVLVPRDPVVAARGAASFFPQQPHPCEEWQQQQQQHAHFRPPPPLPRAPVFQVHPRSQDDTTAALRTLLVLQGLVEPQPQPAFEAVRAKRPSAVQTRVMRCPTCRRRKTGACGGLQATLKCYRRTGDWLPRDVALATLGRRDEGI